MPNKNILFIAGLGGAGFNYVLPRIAKYGNVFAYVPRKLTYERNLALQQYACRVVN